MAPDHVEHWMERNLSWLGEYKLNEIVFLPGSHDAGMCRCNSSTWGGSKGNTVTQSMDILGQLQCGARWFDIRPHWGWIHDSHLEAQWRCGHFNKCPGVGWQGGTGQSIEEVCDQVNNFMNNHNELVILRLTHVQNMYDGYDLPQEKHKELLEYMFNRIKKVRKAARTGPKDHENDCVKIDNMRLGELISKDEGCVIVTSRTFDGPDIKDYAWRDAKIERTDYECNTIGLAIAEDIAEVIISAVIDDPDNATSLRSITTRYQESELPFMPQDLFASNIGPVSMDNIKDDRLLTLCLAASRARYWAIKVDKDKQATPPPVICVYGGKLIETPEVLTSLKNAIEGHGTFSVNNTTMKDEPWSGVRKSCCVYYLEHKNQGDWLFGKGRFAFENSDLDFRVDIDWISWGGQTVVTLPYRDAYAKLFRAITKCGPFAAGNDKFDRWDPASGQKKNMIFRYRSLSGKQVKQRNITEGYEEDFAVDIESVTYHETPVPHPETYEHFFWALQRGGTVQITNELMSNRTDWDPQPGEGKWAKMKYMIEGQEKEWSRLEGQSDTFNRYHRTPEYKPWQAYPILA